MPTYCEHEDCRREARAELGHISLTLGKDELLQKLSDVDSGLVRCRKVPRDGAAKAPFPGEGK